MKKITSVTVWTDAAGMRLAVTYSEIENHRIVKDNVRENFILYDREEIGKAEDVIKLAQEIIDGE